MLASSKPELSLNFSYNEFNLHNYLIHSRLHSSELHIFQLDKIELSLPPPLSDKYGKFIATLHYKILTRHTQTLSQIYETFLALTILSSCRLHTSTVSPRNCLKGASVWLVAARRISRRKFLKCCFLS